MPVLPESSRQEILALFTAPAQLAGDCSIPASILAGGGSGASASSAARPAPRTASAACSGSSGNCTGSEDSGVCEGLSREFRFNTTCAEIGTIVAGAKRQDCTLDGAAGVAWSLQVIRIIVDSVNAALLGVSSTIARPAALYVDLLLNASGVVGSVFKAIIETLEGVLAAVDVGMELLETRIVLGALSTCGLDYISNLP